MENAGYVGLAYQVALERKMTLVSNNIANMDTVGYKSQHARFKEYLSESDPAEPLAMVQDFPEYKNFSNGSLTSTANPLDVALVGNGFLSVRGTDGQDYVTRNGRMQIDNNNRLVTPSGELIMGQGGQPLTIPDGEGPINITKDGMIVGKNGQLGQLKVVSFANLQALQEVGNSLFKTSEPQQADTKTQIQQGYLEGSNVNPIMEMTNMMDVQRAYEGAARMLQNDHDRQRDAIRKLADTH